jgi:integrase/recombinase XerD
VTSLRQRVLDELQRRNYSPATTRGYIHAIKQFAEYFGKSPEQLGAEEIRRFELHLLKEKKLAPATVEGRMSALRFLYKKTLKRRDIAYDDLIFPKTPKKLPVVLSPEEVTRMIEAAPSMLHRTILMVLYATGIRRTEASLLKVSDIDSERMVIHIQQGKGSRDRDVPMTPKLLDALRKYFRWKRPKVYLFPSTAGHRGVEQPLSDHTIWYICSEAAKRAGIKKKRIGAHTLRHSFATTLMESGTDLRTIQLLMGHAQLEHTTRYLHLSQRHLHAAPNPLDQITIGSQSFSRKRPDNYQA